MTCKEIENRLPAYLENLLPPEQRETIEGHLAACPRCSRAFEALRKGMGLVQDLPEVEPPPFFEQRIMARVREEAAQKRGILRKLFFPLYIKIPIQAFATILVAVIAFSVYRTIMPELKDLAPPAVTAPEPAKDPAGSESYKAPESPASVTPVMKAPVKDLPDRKKQGFASPQIAAGAKAKRVAGSPSPLREERASEVKPVAPAVAFREKENLPLRAEASSRTQDRADRQETARSFETPLSEYTVKGKMAGGAAPAPSQIRDAAAVKRSALDLTLRVKDVHIAVREIEKRLARVNGRIIESQPHDGNEFLKAEIAARNLAAFLDAIEAIGRVDVEKGNRDGRDTPVIVNIEIIREP